MQVPDAHVWYGPDSYMGDNLAELFTSLACLSDEEIKELHPGAARQYLGSVRSWLQTSGWQPIASVSLGKQLWNHDLSRVPVLQLTRRRASRPCCRGCTISRRAPAWCTTCLAAL